jgi:hypothetical protein
VTGAGVTLLRGRTAAGAVAGVALGTGRALGVGMNTKEAKAYGRKCKRIAREEGIAHDVAWWVADRSYALGIVDAHGMIDVGGEIARAFASGFGGRP